MRYPREPNDAADIPTPISPDVSRYLEPATVLAGLVALVYFLAWLYLKSFYERLGVPFDSLDMSLTSSVYQVAPLVFILLSLFAFAIGAELTAQKEIFGSMALWGIFPRTLSVRFPDPQGINRRLMSVPTPGLAVAGNLPLLLVLLFLLYFAGIVATHQSEGFRILWLAAGALMAFITLCWKRISIVHLIFIDDTPFFQVAAIVAVLSTLWFVARFAGQAGAVVQVQESKIAIDFSWKDSPPKELDRKTLVLITHQNSKYYVPFKEGPMPDFPKVFIIDDDQVRFAQLKPYP